MPSNIIIYPGSSCVDFITSGGTTQQITQNSTNGGISFGTGNTSSAIGSFAFGTCNTASGNNSFVGGECNTATQNHSFVGGGQCNTSSGQYSVVVGGKLNSASSLYSFIGGGKTNSTYLANNSVVGGGECNNACGNYTFVGGGCANIVCGYCSSIVGGICNRISDSSDKSFIGGGECNKTDNFNQYAVVVGGFKNNSCGCNTFVGGGSCNTASSNYSFVGGGSCNTVTALYSGAFGCGLTNSVACSFMSNQFISTGNIEAGGQFYSPTNSKGSSGAGTVTFNWDDGNIQTVTLTGNPTFAFSNPQSGASYQIIISQDATGGRTITWPTIHWVGSVIPTLTGTANSKDIVTLTYDGTNYYGVIAKNFGT